MERNNIVRMILGRKVVEEIEREIRRYKVSADNDKGWEFIDGEAHYAYRWIPESERSRRIEIAGKFPVVLFPDEQECNSYQDVIEYLHSHLMGDPDLWRVETGRGEMSDLKLWLDFSIRQDYGDGSGRAVQTVIEMNYGWEQAENKHKIDYAAEKKYPA